MGKGKDPLAKRIDALDKNRKKTGFIYGGLDSDDFMSLGYKKDGKTKPKKRGKKLPQDAQYRMKLMYFQFSLYEQILNVNGIDQDYYLTTVGERVDLANDVELDETFFKLSKLEWGKCSSINGLQFRGKFVTYFLFSIVRNSHKIIKGVAKNYFEDDWDSVKKSEKYRFMNEVLVEWIGIVNRATTALLSSNVLLAPELIDVERVLLLAEGQSTSILEHLSETDSLLCQRDEAGLEANNITKMAFALATHSLDLKRCPRYNEELAYKDDRAVLDQVATLGYAILKRRKGARLPILYACFEMAEPEIVSRFYRINEEAPEVTVGLRALLFSTIFYSDRAAAVVRQLL